MILSAVHAAKQLLSLRAAARAKRVVELAVDPAVLRPVAVVGPLAVTEVAVPDRLVQVLERHDVSTLAFRK